jgi:hypothetical protein
LSQIFEQEHCKAAASNKRKQNSRALCEIAEFLKANEFPPYIVHRFFEMSLGIERLDDGMVDEWLRFVKNPHRHVDSPSLWRARAFAAIALDLLVESGANVEKQAQFIAGRYLKSFPCEEKCNSGTVKKWRERFKKGDVKDDAAAKIFASSAEVVAIAKHSLAQDKKELSVEAISNTILDLMKSD